jgi:hypothetical protein
MDIILKKQEIKTEIDKIEDEKLLWAIARLLHLDDEIDIPEWHKQIVEESMVEYKKDKSQLEDWDDVKDKL